MIENSQDIVEEYLRKGNRKALDQCFEQSYKHAGFAFIYIIRNNLENFFPWILNHYYVQDVVTLIAQENAFFLIVYIKETYEKNKDGYYEFDKHHWYGIDFVNYLQKNKDLIVFLIEKTTFDFNKSIHQKWELSKPIFDVLIEKKYHYLVKLIVKHRKMAFSAKWLESEGVQSLFRDKHILQYLIDHTTYWREHNFSRYPIAISVIYKRQVSVMQRLVPILLKSQHISLQTAVKVISSHPDFNTKTIVLTERNISKYCTVVRSAMVQSEKKK